MNYNYVSKCRKKIIRTLNKKNTNTLASNEQLIKLRIVDMYLGKKLATERRDKKIEGLPIPININDGIKPSKSIYN